MAGVRSAPAATDRSRLVELDFGRVFVCDRGPARDVDAVPLVLVHGLAVSHYEFRDVIPELAADRRIVAVDLPGCGESDRPPPKRAGSYALEWLAGALAEVLAVLRVDRFDLLGHSMGGAVATCLVERVPAWVRRLVLVDSICFTMPLPIEGAVVVLPWIGRRLFVHLACRAQVRRHLGRVYSTPELVDEEAVDVYWDRLARRGGREATYAMLRQIRNLDAMRERFAGLRIPTMVIWGDRDVLVPVELGRRLADLVPDADLRVIEGCGHSPNEERPEALIALVREHLGQRAPRR
jgi:pimeloyl-ACP methyl ester carboxylesterase